MLPACRFANIKEICILNVKSRRLHDGHYNMTPLDGKDYESWKNEYLENAEEIKDKDILFQELSEENIQKLGAPKPDIQFPEPLG